MTSQTYSEVEAVLAARGNTRRAYDIAGVTRLLALLGNPQRAFPSIHITGTNGKTSTAKMIDTLMREHGLRMGRYTSPHLHTVRERISIDGRPISAEDFVRLFAMIRTAAAEVDATSTEPLTYFDMTTALGLFAFAEAHVDAAVIEVGVGGTDDSTNVLGAGVCVITPIGLDHTQWLGPTIGEVARNKSGIIHHDAIVIVAEQDDAALTELARRATATGSQLRLQGKDFGVRHRRPVPGGQVVTLEIADSVFRDLFVPLYGGHQAQNAAVALAAVRAFLARHNGQELDPQSVTHGFATATSPGRLERIRQSPTVLLDVAHNPHGAAALAEALHELTFTVLIGVVAVLADKQVRHILEQIEPVLTEVVVTSNSSDRSRSAHDLGQIAYGVFGRHRVTIIDDPAAALQEAIRRASLAETGECDHAGVVVTGSVVTVADARAHLGAESVG